MENKSQRPVPGRNGDPRMNRAVAARLENPELSLFHALRAGGFDWFVGDNEPTDGKEHYFDTDGVSISQRKNQLNRRLRQMKKKAASAKSSRDQDPMEICLPSQNIEKPQRSFNEMYHFFSANKDAGVSHVQQESCMLKSPQTLQYPAAACQENQLQISEKRNSNNLNTSILTEGKQSHLLFLNEHIEDGCSGQGETANKRMKMCSSTSSVSKGDKQLTSVKGSKVSSAMDCIEEIDREYREDNSIFQKNSIFDPLAVFETKKPVQNEKERMRVAADLFHIKNTVLLKKCLLKAGFSAEENIESSATFMEFANCASKKVFNKI